MLSRSLKVRLNWIWYFKARLPVPSDCLFKPFDVVAASNYKLSRDGGSGYRMYVFEESTRRYTIDRKGRGRKEGDIPTRNWRKLYAKRTREHGALL